MSIDQAQVDEITEIINAGQSDGSQGSDPRPDEPQAASDIIGNESGDSADSDAENNQPMEGQAQDGQDQDPGDDTAEPEPEPVTVAGLAEQLGVEAKDLYDELEIPLAEGESITLGEFKDRAKELIDLDGQRVEYEDRKAELEREHLAQQSELQHLMSMIPAEMREHLIAQAGARHRGYVEQQKQTVLEAIPEWKDGDTLSRDRDAIIALGNEYGFSEAEMQYTHDARTLKMVHDHIRLRERLKGVDLDAKRQSKTRAGKPMGKPGKRNSGTLRAALQKAKGSSDPSDQAAAVSHLIRSQ